MIKRFIGKYVKPWFFSASNPDNIKPIKVVITILIGLVIASIVTKLISPKHLTDMFIGIMVGQIAVLLGADTWRSNAKDSNGWHKPKHTPKGEPISYDRESSR